MRDLAGILGSHRIRRQERRAEPVRFYDSASNRHFRALGLMSFALFGPALRKWTDGHWRRRRVRTLLGGARSMDLVPTNGTFGGIAAAGETGGRAMFECVDASGRPLPCGWVMCSYEVTQADRDLAPVLRIDTGAGAPFDVAIPLATGGRGAPSRLVCLPAGRAWRLEMAADPSTFALGRLTVAPLTHTKALRTLVFEHRYSLADAVSVLLGGSGPGGESSYDYWIVHHDLVRDRDRAAIRAGMRRLKQPPSFTIVVPLAADTGGAAMAAIETAAHQLYPHWELVVVGGDGAVADPGRLIARAVQQHPRIRARPDVRGEGLAACLNAVVAESSSDFIVVLRPGHRLAEHALYVLADAADRTPGAGVLYGDHDHVDARGVRGRPCFKPAWNYDLFLHQNLFYPFAAFRRDLVERAGGFREGFDGCADWDLGLRIVEQLEAESIVHLPYVLCHAAAEGSGAAPAREERRATAAARRAVAEHLERTGANAAVETNGMRGPHHRVRWRLPPTPPLVSLIVPTRDRFDLLKPCIDGLMSATHYPSFEVIVVDNGSTDPATTGYLADLRATDGVTILTVPGPFNFSRLCNLGVAGANGEIYVLLNNDTTVFRPDWLEELVGHALRPDVGAVGAKLHYPTGGIQHAGVVLGVWGTAGHAFRLAPSDSGGYCGRAWVTQELSAVTAACLAGRKAVYRRLGGFDETNVGVRYNDVDFCLRLREAGYKVIWTPHAELFHHESGSRGKRLGAGEREAILAEIRYMERRWGPVLLADPAYNPNLTLGAEDFRRTGRPRVCRPWLGPGGR